MSELYLWDRSGPPDPDIQRLEDLLERYRLQTLSPDKLFEEHNRAATTRRRFSPWILAAAACIAIAASTLGYRAYRQHLAATCEIASVRGTVRINNAVVQGSAPLNPGDRVEVDAGGEAFIRVGVIGDVAVGAASLLTLTRFDNRRRFTLERGSVEANIIAAPYVFVIDTPFATAYDLGCAYSLQIAPDGGGRLHVTSGWVLLQNSETESFVGAGTVVEIRRGQAPGVPVRLETLGIFGDNAATISFSEDPAARTQAVTEILSQAKKEDVVMLVNLLWRVDASDRGRVFDLLALFYPPPAAVTREQIIAGNWSVIRSWWTGLGFGRERKLPRRFYVD